MTKITKIDQVSLVQIRKKLNDALDAIEKDLGVKISIGRIRFNEEGFRFDGAAVLSQALTDPYLKGVQIEYINQIKRGPSKNVLLKRFKYNNKTYVVVGLKGKNTLIVKLEGKAHGDAYRLKFSLGDAVFDQLYGTNHAKPSGKTSASDALDGWRNAINPPTDK